MTKQLPKTKPDYSIEYRVLGKNGQWSDWKEKGEGKWIDLETYQKQIKILSRLTKTKIQIKVIKDGQLLDYSGNVTNQPIEYERSR